MLHPKEIIDENEKLLLWNNLIIRNNIYNKNDKEKKGLLHILLYLLNKKKMM